MYKAQKKGKDVHEFKGQDSKVIDRFLEKGSISLEGVASCYEDKSAPFFKRFKDAPDFLGRLAEFNEFASALASLEFAKEEVRKLLYSGVFELKGKALVLSEGYTLIRHNSKDEQCGFNSVRGFTGDINHDQTIFIQKGDKMEKDITKQYSIAQKEYMHSPSLVSSVIALLKGENARYAERIAEIEQGVTERRPATAMPNMAGLRAFQLEQGKQEISDLIYEMAERGLHYLPAYAAAVIKQEQYQRA